MEGEKDEPRGRRKRNVHAGGRVEKPTHLERREEQERQEEREDRRKTKRETS